MQKQSISFFSAVLMNINLMVGAGIYLGPTTMAHLAGDASFLAWPLVAFIFFPLVISIGQLARLFPGEGSFYIYCKENLGSYTAFLASWLYFLGFASVAALQSMGLRDVISASLNISFITDHPHLFSMIFFAGIALFNMLSVNIVARLQSSATLCKIIPLFIVFIISCVYFKIIQPIATLTTLHSVFRSLPVALFGFWGFEACCSISNLIRGDKRNASRAIILGFLITVLLYTLFHYGLLVLMGPQGLAQEGTSAFMNFLPWNTPLITLFMNTLISVSICIAYLSGIFGCFFANSSLLLALARNNLLFLSSSLTKLNKNDRPWVSILAFAATAFLLSIIFTNKEPLFALTNIGVLITFFLTFVSLFIIQKQRRNWWGCVMTTAAFISCGIFTYYSLLLIGTTPLKRVINCAPLIVFALLGTLLFFMRERKRRVKTEEP